MERFSKLMRSLRYCRRSGVRIHIVEKPTPFLKLPMLSLINLQLYILLSKSIAILKLGYYNSNER